MKPKTSIKLTYTDIKSFNHDVVMDDDGAVDITSFLAAYPKKINVPRKLQFLFQFDP